TCMAYHDEYQQSASMQSYRAGRFVLENVRSSFKLTARTKDHHTACRDRDFLACLGISSSASRLTSHCKFPKAEDRDGLPFVQRGLEEIKNPLQQHDCIAFREP